MHAEIQFSNGFSYVFTQKPLEAGEIFIQAHRNDGFVIFDEYRMSLFASNDEGGNFVGLEGGTLSATKDSDGAAMNLGLSQMTLTLVSENSPAPIITTDALIDVPYNPSDFSHASVYFVWFGLNDRGNNDLNYQVAGAVQSITTVPIPATAWLFSSGLLGLLGTRIKSRSLLRAGS